MAKILLLVGKLRKWGLLKVDAPAPLDASLQMLGCLSKCHFLDDAGTVVSVLPSTVKPSYTLHQDLLAANSMKIHTYVLHTLTLDLGLQEQLRWIFSSHLCEATNPGFLQHHKLIMDCVSVQL